MGGGINGMRIYGPGVLQFISPVVPFPPKDIAFWKCIDYYGISIFTSWNSLSGNEQLLFYILASFGLAAIFAPLLAGLSAELAYIIAMCMGGTFGWIGNLSGFWPTMWSGAQWGSKVLIAAYCASIGWIGFL